jgi:hypothetical protein
MTIRPDIRARFLRVVARADAKRADAVAARRQNAPSREPIWGRGEQAVRGREKGRRVAWSRRKTRA